MRLPMKYTAGPWLIDFLSSTQAEVLKGWWVPARPLDGGPFWQRFQLAWAVFTGRADALFWIRQ